MTIQKGYSFRRTSIELSKLNMTYNDKRYSLWLLVAVTVMISTAIILTIKGDKHDLRRQGERRT
jgi:hypothetical protein